MAERPPLNKAIQSALAALGIVLAGIGGLTGDYYLRPTVDLVYDTVTENEYIQIRDEMVAKIRTVIDAKGSITHVEYATWNAVLKEEISREGTAVLNGIEGNNIQEKLLEWMEAR